MANYKQLVVLPCDASNQFSSSNFSFRGSSTGVVKGEAAQIISLGMAKRRARLVRQQRSVDIGIRRLDWKTWSVIPLIVEVWSAGNKFP